MGAYIISEIGINHNGDIELVKKMIESSKKAGVDAVKFQKRDINLVYSKEQLEKHRESPWGKTEREQKQGLELSQKDYEIINEYCKSLKIEWFASAWDMNSVSFLENFKLNKQKVPSALIVDLDYLEVLAKKKKYTFISTGMCEMKNIEHAVDIFKKNKCPFELMHCISAYPFEDKIANLNMIPFLREKFNCKVGYSGHEKGGTSISVAAVVLGATSLERHFTLDRTMYGSDQAASLSPEGLVNLVQSVKKVEAALSGKLEKKILDIEVDVAKKLRANIKTR
jgi:N-acetylneuraminate synthase